MKKKIIPTPMSILFSTAAMFAIENPELMEAMNSQEEQERLDQMFEEIVKENNESEKTEE